MIAEETWAARADAAYYALVGTYWSPCRGRFRPCSRRRPFGQWFYWWQAHALEAVVDAAVRTGDRAETARAAALVAGIRRRNGGSLRNAYHDDMAWLALALLRAHTELGLHTRPLVADLWSRLHQAVDVRRGALPWRVGSDFYNVAANAPVAVLAARLGEVGSARALTGWLHETLVVDGEVFDGVRADGTVERTAYSYNYGTVIGADVALAAATGDRAPLAHAGTVARAVGARLCEGATGLLPPEGGGDGGLFKGILAAYLAAYSAATGDGDAYALLVRNGEAAWAARRAGLVGPDWSRPPQGAVDLSQHLSGVLLFGALARGAGAGGGSGSGGAGRVAA